MGIASARLVPLAAGLVLALTAAVAPAAAQEPPAAPPEIAVAPPGPAPPGAPGRPLFGSFPPLTAGPAALTERERLLLSLFPAGCGSEIAFDSSPDNECPDPLTPGQGVGCTLEEAQRGVLDALKGNCADLCSRSTCGERKKDRCGSFGYGYKSDPDDCTPITAPDCPDQMGFVCDANGVRCICICANA